VHALRDPNVAHVLLLSFTVLLLLGAVLCFAVGIGLLFRTNSTLALFAVLNRWVSTRQVLKSVEIPRTSDLHVRDTRRRWVTGLLFAIGGGYAAYRLALGVDAVKFVAGLRVRAAMAPVWLIVVETLRWSLVVLCTGATVLGVVLVAFPSAWPAIEARANRWYSTRQLASGGDTMHLTIDRWVELYPKPAGALVTALAFIPLLGAGLLFFGR